MKKTGFTLVELLAVIAILAIILVISVPKVISVIDNAKQKTIEDTANIVASQAEKEYFKRKEMSTLDQYNDPITCDDIVTINNTDYKSCSVDFSADGTAYVSLYGDGRLDGYYCLSTTKNDANCNGEVAVYEESILNGAYPRISDGMIPVTIADNGIVTTVNPTSSSWYNYSNKIWANVVLVKENGTQTRSYYQSNYNVTVNEADILAYLVWIPRYRYTLWNVAGLQATYTGGCSNTSYNSPTTCATAGYTWTDPVCTSNCPQSISIIFEDANTTKSTVSTNGTQLTHPAFTYGGVELNGIWVGKFETTQGTTLNVGTTNPTIKPNLPSWRNQNVSTQFNTSLLFGTNISYGLIGESRMSKNSDWGAIVYLSHSQYGINTEIRINNNTNYTTGCGASVNFGSSTSTCEIAYGSGVASYPQSTTGNISGIFDMSGGASENQMGVYTDISNNKYSGRCDYYAYNSGYKGIYGNPSGHVYCNSSISINTIGLDYPGLKYYKMYVTADIYSNNNYLGEALGETNFWYKDFNWIPALNHPWINRGGHNSYGTGSGTFQIVDSNGYGGANTGISFRTIVTTS